MSGALIGIFDADGRSLVDGKPDLDQATLDVVGVKSIVSANDLPEPTLDAENCARIDVARIWLLRPGARLSEIPAPERYATRSILRTGNAVLLLAPDAATELAVREALLALVDEDESGQGRFGHA